MTVSGPLSTTGTLPETGVSRYDAPALVDQIGHVSGGLRRHRARVAHDRIRAQTGHQTVVAARRPLGRQRRRPTRPGTRPRPPLPPSQSPRAGSRLLGDRAGRLGGAVVQHELVTPRMQPARHGGAHPADADDRDRHSSSQPPSTCSSTPLTDRLRIRKSTASTMSAIATLRPSGVRALTRARPPRPCPTRTGCRRRSPGAAR